MDFAELKALVAQLENEETPDNTPVFIRHKGQIENVESVHSYQEWNVKFSDGDSEVVHENDLDYYRSLDGFMHEEYVTTVVNITTGR